MKISKVAKRLVVTATLAGALGGVVATAAPAGASQSWHSCNGLNTAYSNSGGANYYPGQAWHACD